MLPRHIKVYAGPNRDVNNLSFVCLNPTFLVIIFHDLMPSWWNEILDKGIKFVIVDAFSCLIFIMPNEWTGRVLKSEESLRCIKNNV